MRARKRQALRIFALPTSKSSSSITQNANLGKSSVTEKLIM
jgi:hypothetical protein